MSTMFVQPAAAAAPTHEEKGTVGGQPRPSPYVPLRFNPLMDQSEPPRYGVGRIQTIWTDTPNHMDACCGCPCCNSNGQHITCEEEPINELRGIYSPEQWKQFTYKVRRIVQKTFLPPCPFCLVPIISCLIYDCCANLFHSSRESALQALIAEENRRLSDIGLKWQLNWYLPVDGGSIVPARRQHVFTMTWIPGIRESYEAAHPEQRQITKEPYPEQLISPQVKAKRAAADAAEQQRIQLRLLQSLVAEGHGNTSAVVSAPPIYGTDLSAPPPPYKPAHSPKFCSECGAPRVGVIGPFCPNCGFEAS